MNSAEKCFNQAETKLEIPKKMRIQKKKKRKREMIGGFDIIVIVQQSTLEGACGHAKKEDEERVRKRGEWKSEGIPNDQ